VSEFKPTFSEITQVKDIAYFCESAARDAKITAFPRGRECLEKLAADHSQAAFALARRVQERSRA